jgi:hypothetical protein
MSAVKDAPASGSGGTSRGRARRATAAPPTPRLGDIALAALAAHVFGDGVQRELERGAEGGFLRARSRPPEGSWREELERFKSAPAPGDARAAALASDLALEPLELLVLGLLLTVEEEPWVGRVLAAVQAPLGGSRPTLALAATAFGTQLGGASPAESLAELRSGVAVGSGLFALAGDSRPLVEQTLSLPAPLYLAARGRDGLLPGVSIGLGRLGPLPLPPSFLAEIERRAAVLARSSGCLVIRSGAHAEARAAACELAARLGRRAAFLEREAPPGVVPWLRLGGLLPVFVFDLGPAERRTIPTLCFHDGPVLAVAGLDGAVESPEGTAVSWSLPVPAEGERRALWQTGLGAGDLAARLARDHRHGAGRIAELSRLAWEQCRFTGDAAPTVDHVHAAACDAEGTALAGLARALPARVPDGALVTTRGLRGELEALLQRCRVRDRLGEGLGPSITARYRPGVRALFVGPSGTGKTLAAGWLATQLAVPLYRVDVAAVSSKYIGETEKNLAHLLARAEQAEVVLLFDEADALFGKRTDIRDANDRYANATTNYLLERIESFDGIVVLTSNSQSRFDSAFSRRLDAVIEFPLPPIGERRELWGTHLGPSHGLAPAEVNKLAALVDLPGGHLRNVVLAAAVRARGAERALAYDDVIEALVLEYRKLGRALPGELRPPARQATG